MQEPRISKEDSLLLLTVLIWGINFPILKQVLEVMHPFVVNVFRFITSMLALWVMMAVQRKSLKLIYWAEIKPYLGRVLVLGLLGYFFYQVAFIMGIARTTAGNSALIMASTPIWTAIIGMLFGFEKLGKTAWFGLAISVIGTFLIAIFSGKTISLSGSFFLGNMFTLAAAVMWGSYTAFSRPVTSKIDPLVLIIAGLLFAFPLNFGIAVPYFEQIDWSIVTFSVWAAILYSGGLSTGIAVAIWIIVVQRVGATHTAVFGNLVPLVALIGGYLLLGESITLLQITGGALILGGLLIMRGDRESDSESNRENEAD